jgi:hypothetical protein
VERLAFVFAGDHDNHALLRLAAARLRGEEPADPQGSA